MTDASGVEWLSQWRDRQKKSTLLLKMWKMGYVLYTFCSGEAISDLIRDELSWLSVKQLVQ